jgi:hypothetical protein
MKDNYILCEYNIKNEDLNKDIQILNYLNKELKETFINVLKQIGKTDYILETLKILFNSSFKEFNICISLFKSSFFILYSHKI